jgi:hypothetical protein
MKPVLWRTEIVIFASVSRLDFRPSVSIFILVQVFKRYTLTLEYFLEINKFMGTEGMLVVLPPEVEWKGYEVNHSPPAWYFHGTDRGNIYTTPHTHTNAEVPLWHPHVCVYVCASHTDNNCTHSQTHKYTRTLSVSKLCKPTCLEMLVLKFWKPV